MGLDTSHDCWSGPYSQFMRWRTFLSFAVMTERGRAGDEQAKQIGYKGITDDGYIAALDAGVYEDQAIPINVLLSHSDCDGEIAAYVCGPLADALQALIERQMPARGVYDTMRPATERFIAGLRKAAAAGEAVEFY